MTAMGGMRGVYLALFTFSLAACGPAGIGDPSQTGEGSTSSATTSSSSSSSESSDSDSSTGEGTTSTATTTDPSATDFVPMEPDLGWVEDCDMWEQDCAEGEKCVPWASTGGSWDDAKCVPVLGEQAAGEPCVYGGAVDATDDCDAGTHCWNVMEVEGEMLGTCTPFCTNVEDPMCPMGYACSVSSSLAICIETCDPIEQDCAEGTACFWTHSDFSCVFTTQDIPLGQPCGFINDCAEGSLCLTAEVMPDCEGSSCCAAFCDLGLGDEPCAAGLPGTVCYPFFEAGMVPEGQEHIGVCILPQDP